MRPAVRDGDLVLVDARAGDWRPGDLLVVELPEGGLCTHRLLGRAGSGASALLILKGDANRLLDPPREPSSVLGRVVLVGRSDPGWPAAGPVLAAAARLLSGPARKACLDGRFEACLSFIDAAEAWLFLFPGGAPISRTAGAWGRLLRALQRQVLRDALFSIAERKLPSRGEGS